jgi:type IV secretory pathway VirB3-like protein
VLADMSAIHALYLLQNEDLGHIRSGYFWRAGSRSIRDIADPNETSAMGLTGIVAQRCSFQC